MRIKNIRKGQQRVQPVYRQGKSLRSRRGSAAVNGSRAVLSLVAPFPESFETGIPSASAGAIMTNAQVDLSDVAVQVEIISKVSLAPVHGTMKSLTERVMDTVQMVPQTIPGLDMHLSTA